MLAKISRGGFSSLQTIDGIRPAAGAASGGGPSSLMAELISRTVNGLKYYYHDWFHHVPFLARFPYPQWRVEHKTYTATLLDRTQ